MSDDPGKQLVDIGADLMEVGLDSVLDDDLLKELPALGTGVKLARLAKSIRDRLFLKKVKRFLEALPEQSEQSRQRFRDEIMSDPKKRAQTGEAIVLLLDQFTDMEKPEILARIFAAYLEGKISFPDFRRLGHAIELAFTDDLQALVRSADLGEYSVLDFTLENLVRTGLTEVRFKEAHPRKEQAIHSRRWGSIVEPMGYLSEKLIEDTTVQLTDLGELYVVIMANR